jgi:hypothetical protein
VCVVADLQSARREGEGGRGARACGRALHALTRRDVHHLGPPVEPHARRESPSVPRARARALARARATHHIELERSCCSAVRARGPPAKQPQHVALRERRRPARGHRTPVHLHAPAIAEVSRQPRAAAALCRLHPHVPARRARVRRGRAALEQQGAHALPPARVGPELHSGALKRHAPQPAAARRVPAQPQRPGAGAAAGRGGGAPW